MFEQFNVYRLFIRTKSIANSVKIFQKLKVTQKKKLQQTILYFSFFKHKNLF